MTTKDERHEEFVRLLLDIQKPLQGFVFAHVQNASQVDDIVQDISVTLWRRFDQYDSGRPFLGWALGIARNKILHAKRQSARSRLVFDNDMAMKLAHCYDKCDEALEERRTLLRACLQRLSRDGQLLLAMRYRRNLSMNAIAEKVQRKVGAVTVALARIRNTLKECMDRHAYRESAGTGGGQ